MGRAADHHQQQSDAGAAAQRAIEVLTEAVGVDASPKNSSWSSLASPREVGMAARIFVSLVLVSMVSISTALAGDGVTVAGLGSAAAAHAAASPEHAVTASVEAPASISPWVHSSMPETMVEKLEIAFDLATERVREVPECRALFEELGADAESTLGDALYFPANPQRETTLCRRAAAYTYVGSRPTRLCRRFATLSDDWAALIVVHEALHGAGLTEKPHDPRGMSAGAINTMVSQACQF